MSYVSTKLKKEIIIDEIVTIHYFEYMKNFIFPGESHAFWEFLYVDKGCVVVQSDNQYYNLDAGDIIFHKPNEFHAFSSKGEKAPNLVAISFLTNSPMIDFFTNRHLTLTPEERKIISQIIAEAKTAFSTPLHVPTIEQVILAEHMPFGAQQMISLYLELFFITVKRNHSDKNSSANKVLVSPDLEFCFTSESLKQIIQFMELHICEPLSVQQICEEFSLSRSTLQSLFHKEKKCGMMDYFRYLKIEQAKEIFRSGKMNLTETAHYLSFSSLQHFSKQFKKATGMSPQEYVSSVKGMSQSVSRFRSSSFKR